MGNFINVTLSILSIHRAFDFISCHKDDKARSFIKMKRFESLSCYPASLISIQYTLLKMFLEMEARDKIRPSLIITYIRRSRDINGEEKKFLLRYVISVIWISRGRQGECLLRIRHNLDINTRLVRRILKDRFSSPDVPDDI